MATYYLNLISSKNCFAILPRRSGSKFAEILWLLNVKQLSTGVEVKSVIPSFHIIHESLKNTFCAGVNILDYSQSFPAQMSNCFAGQMEFFFFRSAISTSDRDRPSRLPFWPPAMATHYIAWRVPGLFGQESGNLKMWPNTRPMACKKAGGDNKRTLDPRDSERPGRGVSRSHSDGKIAP